MFVLIDIATMRWRSIVWSIEKARLLPASNVAMIAELPAALAEPLVERQISREMLFEGITRYACNHSLRH